MARPVSKFVQMDDSQRQALAEIQRDDRLSSKRRRAQALLLSDRDYTPAQIADIIGGHPDTVRKWIDAFNQNGIDGITDAPRSGSDLMLNEQQQQVLRDLIETHPNQTQVVIAKLAKATGVKISETSFRRYCHRFGLVWKRFRKSLKHKRDETKFRAAKRKLAKLVASDSRQVVYFDESAMTLRAVVPYGWQPIGERQFVPVTGGSYRSLQLLGFEPADGGDPEVYMHRGRVNSETVIDVMDDFIATLGGKPTTIVLDGASVHTSRKFERARRRWRKLGVRIFRLPPYSPELNRIEMLWKRLKYQWMPSDAWQSFEDMLACAKAILDSKGQLKLLSSAH